MFSRLVPRGTYVFAFAAIVLTIAYAAYLAPDWDPARDDQRQYVALARGLVERGEYTHAGVGEPFIPEPLRFPGYPLFLAPLCVSGCDPWVIAVAQAVALAALVLLTAHLARPLLGARGAVAAAALARLLPGPIAGTARRFRARPSGSRTLATRRVRRDRRPRRASTCVRGAGR